ncbi:hypothetical protein [Kosakonia oryziphila]|uniref:hypothetical protein n=1 Tax=Kosakonia oryziphila TaxID=1005667 RepID=UPI0014289BDD|nr:hypothetical protein [Kosakonia oryziphila]
MARIIANARLAYVTTSTLIETMNYSLHLISDDNHIIQRILPAIHPILSILLESHRA